MTRKCSLSLVLLEHVVILLLCETSHCLSVRLLLVTVSYEWSFHEYTPDADDFAPEGYWIQLAFHILSFELLDCAAVADATIMISLSLVGRFIVGYSASLSDRKFKAIRDVLQPSMYRKQSGCCKCLIESALLTLTLSLTIVFLVVLFSFAASGFFRQGVSRSTFLLVVSFAFKMIFGVRIIYIGSSRKWDQLRSILNPHMAEDDPQHKLVGSGAYNATDQAEPDDDVL